MASVTIMKKSQATSAINQCTWTKIAEAMGYFDYKKENRGQAYLLVSLEVSLLKRLVEPRARVCESGVASWDRLGEAGGPL